MLVWLCLSLVVWSWARPAAAGDGPAVRQARVWLTLHRGGERLPDGSRVDARGARVDGVVEYTLVRPAKEGETLVLLDFAAWLDEEPRHLDEVALATYVEGPFDAGALRIGGAWGASVERVGPRRDIQLSLKPGTRTITLRYTVEVPHRYWPFGCIRQRCSLSGAIAPLPSAPARGGRHLPEGGRVVTPVRWIVEEAKLAEPGALPTGTPTKPGGEPRQRRRPVEVVVVGNHRYVQYPSVFWGPKWHRVTAVHHGVTIEVLHMFARPGDTYPRERAVRLRRDVAGQTSAIAEEMIELVEAAGLEQPAGSRLVIVQGPLRSVVSEFHPEVVVVSDQAFEMLPIRRFLRFHQEAIARGILDMLVERSLRGRHDPSTDLWLSGAVAFALLEVWRAERELPDEFASDILRNFTFVPAVDRFLYTQQASFSQAYFRGVEDAPPLRNHPLWFSHELTTGRRIHEKLLDTLGPERQAELYRRLLAEPSADPRPVAEQAYGYTLDWFFDQWLGPYPSVNYSVVGVRQEREGDVWRNSITIRREGKTPVIEPVQVLVTERDGEQHYLVWNGEIGTDNRSLDDEPAAGTHTFELVTDSKIDTVRLDPRQRLVQEPQPPRENVDPLFDDRHPPSLRFLYTGAGLSIAASEFVNAATVAARFNAITGFVTFEGSLRRDLRRTGHVIVARDRETNVAVGLGSNLWFGDKVNRQRRRSRVRLFFTTSWLNSKSLDPRGGLRLIERLSLVDDTRRFSWWPEFGHFMELGVAARQTIRVDEGPADHRHDLAIEGSWMQLWRLAHDHVIASIVHGEVIVPLVREPEFRSLARVGGIGGLSGYTADEVFGLAQASAQLEYRHVFVNDLHANLLHGAWLRSIGGAAYTGVATTSRCESYGGWFSAESWYAHVGYGLTAYLQILGVTPQLFRLDFSVPLVRRKNQVCLGEVLPDYLAEVQGIEDADRLLPPFQINVLFQHAF